GELGAAPDGDLQDVVVLVLRRLRLDVRNRGEAEVRPELMEDEDRPDEQREPDEHERNREVLNGRSSRPPSSPTQRGAATPTCDEVAGRCAFSVFWRSRRSVTQTT